MSDAVSAMARRARGAWTDSVKLSTMQKPGSHDTNRASVWFQPALGEASETGPRKPCSDTPLNARQEGCAPMTPSRWHDDASDRDAGHDEMQLSVLQYLRSKKPEPLEGEQGAKYERHYVGAEYPFVSRGQVIAFADICEVWRKDRKDYDRSYKYFYVAYEIKPKIYSVGAVIRQCLALEQAIIRSGTGGDPAGSRCNVIPVVSRDDPKLGMLAAMYDGSVWTWDPPRQELVR